MKWFGISGSWRTVDEAVENDVRRDVAAIYAAGGGIVTGGALGVDFIATDEALRCDPSASRLKVILPTPLDIYIRHYFNRAAEGVIRQEQAYRLAAQLQSVHAANAEAVVEMDFDECSPETYYARNTEVVNASDALLAFQVNESAGTQDTIDKAVAKGIPVTRRRYKI